MMTRLIDYFASMLHLMTFESFYVLCHLENHVCSLERFV